MLSHTLSAYSVIAMLSLDIRLSDSPTSKAPVCWKYRNLNGVEPRSIEFFLAQTPVSHSVTGVTILDLTTLPGNRVWVKGAFAPVTYPARCFKNSGFLNTGSRGGVSCSPGFWVWQFKQLSPSCLGWLHPILSGREAFLLPSLAVILIDDHLLSF